MKDVKFSTGRVLVGDCVERMREMPDNSIDAVVTDPPYELGFMGKKWDASGIAYSVAMWGEALRVLKPGGHLLAFGGTRTFHRMTVAIEDAGFEVRDSIAWMYGSGFPKSLDVSKAIDRMKHDRHEIEEVVRWMEATRQRSGVTRRQVEERFGTVNIGQALFTITPGSTPRVPTLEQVDVLLNLFGLTIEDVPHDIYRLLIDKNAAKGQPGPNWLKREVVGTKMSGIANKAEGPRHTIGASKAVEVDVTLAATEEAARWDGWGTALKPAHEPIVMARKPLIGTVAGNVLEHGTGALNIDGSRIGTDGGGTNCGNRDADGRCLGHDNAGRSTSGETVHGANGASGRWPANIVLDGAAAAALDQQSEGASRYFTQADFGPDDWPFVYQAKPSKRERNAGLEEGNVHPTVKPVALMRHLVRLVTPPGGTVLDPFLGSGTTAVAAILEGHSWLGCEMTDDYMPIIKGRVAWAEHQTATGQQLTLGDQP